ncbi:MAG: hypothetical protein RCG16_03445 [Rickettsia hoogstraalii]
MSDKLDFYEQDIEDNFEKQQTIDDKDEIALLQKAAKIHVSKMSIGKAKKEFFKK